MKLDKYEISALASRIRRKAKEAEGEKVKKLAKSPAIIAKAKNGIAKLKAVPDYMFGRYQSRPDWTLESLCHSLASDKYVEREIKNESVLKEEITLAMGPCKNLAEVEKAINPYE